MTRDEKLDLILRQQTTILDLIASIKRDLDTRTDQPDARPPNRPAPIDDPAQRAQMRRITETPDQTAARQTEIEALADLQPIPTPAPATSPADIRTQLTEHRTHLAAVPECIPAFMADPADYRPGDDT